MNIGTFPLSPQDLLLKMQTQLQQGGTQPWSNIPGAGLADLAFLSLWPDELHLKNPRGRQFVAIRPNRFPIWQSVITGAGTTLDFVGGDPTVPGFNPVVTCACYCQINADPEQVSTQAISEETIGVISFVLRVIKALQFWMPFDPDADATYLREPARVTDGGFGLQPRKVGDAWWIAATVDFELKMTSSFPT